MQKHLLPYTGLKKQGKHLHFDENIRDLHQRWTNKPWRREEKENEHSEENWTTKVILKVP